MIAFKIRKIIILFILIFFNGYIYSLYSFHPPREKYYINNNSNKIIKYTFEIEKDRKSELYQYFQYFVIDLNSRNKKMNNGNIFFIMNIDKNINSPKFGTLLKFKNFIKDFIVYDEYENTILTSEDLREGDIIEYDYDEKGNRIIRNKHEREGNMKIEYYGKPDDYWTEVHCIIEITDELIERGRQKYGDR